MNSTLGKVALAVIVSVVTLTVNYFSGNKEEANQDSSTASSTSNNGNLTLKNFPSDEQKNDKADNGNLTLKNFPSAEKKSDKTEASRQDQPVLDNRQQVLADIKKAGDTQRSGWWLATEGKVIKHLRDDTTGSQHQKFILELERGVTMLVAHNIDIAPRVPVKEGQNVKLRARYEWNHKGGVLHWTHRDLKGRQKGGWIYYNGKYYK